MAGTVDLFGQKPRKPRQWLMHVIDAGNDCCVSEPGEQLVRYGCQRCGHETDWVTARNVTEAKRGIPCPKCNTKTG